MSTELKSQQFSTEKQVSSRITSWGLVHTGNEVEFDTVDFVESRQSRPCSFSPVHTGYKVERTLDIWATKIAHFRQVDRVEHVQLWRQCRLGIGDSRLSTKWWQSRLWNLSPICPLFVNFRLASVYRLKIATVEHEGSFVSHTSENKLYKQLYNLR